MAINVTGDEVVAILERYGMARNRKSQSDNLRLEAGKYAWPPAQDQVRNSQQSEGQLRTERLYDSTALMAAYRMTSGIFSYLMPVGAKWFEFVAQEPELNQDEVMQGWLSKATAQTHKEIWRSNFQREMFMTIRSMIVFGTGVISVEKIEKEIIFRAHHIGFMFFDDNSRGEIDTVYRQIFYTVRQAMQEFGEENLGKAAQKAIKAKKWDEKFEYVHVTAPNKDFDKTKIDATSKKIKSLYINVQEKNIVKQGGFDQLPYLIARFALIPGEIMGRGPTIEGLPEIKMLNRMKRTFLEAAEKAVNPPLVAEDDGVVGQPVTSAGGMIFMRPGAMEPHALQTGANIQLNAEVIAGQIQLVKEIHFNDLFSALAQHRNMTATEVVERVEEKIVHLAPAVTSLQKEIFSPLIVRVLKLLIGMKRVEEPPQDFDMDVVYQGRLALAMSNMQTNAIESTLAKWAPYGEASQVFDNVDWDTSFRTSWLNSGAPAEGLKDFETMMEQRQEKDQLAKAQIESEIADTASKAYKNVGKAPEPNSLADEL